MCWCSTRATGGIMRRPLVGGGRIPNMQYRKGQPYIHAWEVGIDACTTNPNTAEHTWEERLAVTCIGWKGNLHTYTAYSHHESFLTRMNFSTNACMIDTATTWGASLRFQEPHSPYFFKKNGTTADCGTTPSEKWGSQLFFGEGTSNKGCMGFSEVAGIALTHSLEKVR